MTSNAFLTAAAKLSLLGLVAIMAGCAAEQGSEDPAEDTNATESEIVGGSLTSSYAAVGALTTSTGFPFCTGTVIAPRVVVTAAHCLAEPGTSASGIRFALGPDANNPSSVLRVKRIAYHPQYDEQQIKNDIGVVILSADAPVAPVPANTSMTSSWVGKSLTFVGYGVTNGSTQTGAGRKRVVSIPISQVGATQFAYQTRGKNTCNGDSGGPAFATDASGNLTVVGVTSYGDASCTSYGVDTRVDAFKSFIASVPTN
ncbi:MAG: trypsin-like serine protease [Labilithrix sp.]